LIPIPQQSKDGSLQPKKAKSYSSIFPVHIKSKALSSACFSPDSKQLLISTSGSSHLMLISVESSKTIELLKILTVESGNKKKSKPAVNGKLNGINGNGNGKPNGINGNGKHHSDDESSDEEVIEQEQPTAEVMSLTWSNDGKWVLVIRIGGRMEVWDMEKYTVSCYYITSFQRLVLTQ
jgi:WD40 repeat protein